jgi:hypothetical protein
MKTSVGEGSTWPECGPGGSARGPRQINEDEVHLLAQDRRVAGPKETTLNPGKKIVCESFPGKLWAAVRKTASGQCMHENPDQPNKEERPAVAQGKTKRKFGKNNMNQQILETEIETDYARSNQVGSTRKVWTRNFRSIEK